jgi:hypothetical protein
MAAKRKSAKKTSVKQMSQAHGKVEKFEPTTLDQIWGDTGNSVYGTMNEQVYIDRIDGMNLSDMQTHASKVGIIPIDNRVMLRDRLLREFRKHVSSYRKPIQEPDASEKLNEQAMKILSEGR